MTPEIEAIRRKLNRPLTRLTAGGFRPTHQDDESWLGKVFLFRPDEDIPRNASGQPLLPYAQFHIPSLPVRSSLLDGVRILTLFLHEPLPEQLEPMGDNWVIREYGFDDVLVRKDLAPPDHFLRPFPLKMEAVPDDHPLWDGGGVPYELEEEILQLERLGVIDSYYDIVTHTYDHKFGGWPSYCQSGVHPGGDYEFIFQISTDDKINLNVIDNGSLMFWKSRTDGRWAIYYDFH
ncbi:DUF1963 domain-containing protein [Bordetella genomosp. 13]|uniref:DUF1963 domain-containing protein n=1 Tax=Bordetella genomosp. 13 TaxID=463040 RepID=UPI0011AAE4C0|nr:DUF1963 domain-containing protein [Bordetella genomosp. 13]